VTLLRLSKKWQNKLLAFPESGMGYHKVDVILKNGKRIIGLIVLNSEKLLIPKEIAPFTEKDIEDIILSTDR